MLQFVFLINSNNYSSWTPIYLLDLLILLSEVESRFQERLIAIQQKSSSFDGMKKDLATEKTIIKDRKSSGDIVGLTFYLKHVDTLLTYWNNRKCLC